MHLYFYIDWHLVSKLPVTWSSDVVRCNLLQMGEIQDVLVTEVSHDKQFYVGHNKCYDQVHTIKFSISLNTFWLIKLLALYLKY